jgi:hypothetical protein
MEAFEYSPHDESAARSGIFTDDKEMELAARFLEVRDEQELDQFLGDLIKSAGNVIGKVVGGPAGQAIGGVLKGLAKKALPFAGAALGGMFGGPLGAQIGSGLASVAGPALGLELEGLSQEDREFEAARRFVRLAGDTSRNALEGNPYADQDAVARGAAVEAVRIHAPGWAHTASPSKCHSGQWVRHHGKIILFGV